jgi:hypothetical protein
MNVVINEFESMPPRAPASEATAPNANEGKPSKLEPRDLKRLHGTLARRALRLRAY